MISRIVFNNVSLNFTTKIFDTLNVELRSGKIIAITGVNGSGKSTFLKLAGQFIQPDEGSITAFEDDKIINRVDFRKKIAVIAPNLNLYSELTAVENLKFFVGLRNITLSDQNINDLFSRVEIDTINKYKFIKTFSTGMIQRLKFAILLAINADIWLLDEPCSNLDIDGKKIFLNEIKSAAKDKLILIATNDIDEAKISDEIISLPIN
ncbi:MAG: ABC transporter ATP-binding protein [Selenomonadaceae bacterium]|nr:ABC transporter ATP-binding protein [Selenomonadaceae bacterium]